MEDMGLFYKKKVTFLQADFIFEIKFYMLCHFINIIAEKIFLKS